MFLQRAPRLRVNTHPIRVHPRVSAVSFRRPCRHGNNGNRRWMPMQQDARHLSIILDAGKGCYLGKKTSFFGEFFARRGSGVANWLYLVVLLGDRSSGGAAAPGFHSSCPVGGGMKRAGRRCKNTPKQTAGFPIMGATLLRSKGVRGLRPASGGTNRLKSVPRTTDAPSTCPRLPTQPARSAP